MTPRDQLREFLRTPRDERQLRMDAIVPTTPEHLTGWTYWDMPGWLSHDEWHEFREVIGEENIVDLSFAATAVQSRGQFFFSPEGMARLNAFIAHS